MRIALWQTAGGTSPADTLDRLDRRAAEAAAGGARLLIGPELLTSGYNIGECAWDLAEPTDGPTAQATAAMAARHGLALLFGFPERAGERIHNSALFAERDGRALAYRKMHLYGPDEKRLFAPGDTRPPVLDIDGIGVAPMICYDVEFPEAVRGAVEAGAELIAVPTALMAPMDFVAEALIRVRAYENGCFVAYCNRVGREGDLSYVGQSCIAAPDASTLIRGGAEDDALLFADIDPGAYAAFRAAYPYRADRRRDLYPG